MLRIEDNRELQASVLSFKAADRNLRKEINQRTRDTLNPVWRSVVADNLAGRDALTHSLLVGGVRIAAGNPAVAKAAQSRRAIGKGKRLIPTRDYFIAEFGVNRDKKTTYQRKNRKGSGTHTVTRRVNAGKPRRVPEGRVVFPAFAEVGPRMVSLWVQTIVRTYHDAAEGKGA